MNPIQAAASVLPVSTKHHIDFKMLLLPSKHPFLLVEETPSQFRVVRNVADYQWNKMMRCDPGLLARNFGVTTTPVRWPESPDPAKWFIVVSYKGVPLAEVTPVTMHMFGSLCEVVDRVRVLDVESFERYTLMLKGK